MLEELRIKDLGVIAESTLELGPGFTAITGETGAGKTMVVTALGLLMGERSDSSLVRHGAAQSRVGGALVLDARSMPDIAEIVDLAGGELADSELLITRSVSAEGTSRATACGVRVSAAILRDLAAKLFCVHGQSDQLRLRSKTEQRTTLDKYAGEQLLAVLREYQRHHREVLELSRLQAEISENRQERVRERARLEAETAEIIAAAVQPGELADLQQQIAQLENAEQTRQALAQAQAALAGENAEFQADAQTLVARAESALAAAVENEQLQVAAAKLAEAAELLRESGGIIAAAAAGYDADVTQALTAAQERVAELNQLCRKYGPELSDVLVYLENASQRLSQLGDDDETLSNIAAQLAEKTALQESAAAQLTQLRSAAASKLAAEVTAEIRALALPESSLEIAVLPADPGEFGADSVEFLLVPYSGATARPLAKAASGGELSRIMLALEVVLAEVSPVPTFVFDEIDAGIGGAAAIEVGKRLQKLSQTSQVIVVTHLAQVAAFANNHVRVVKDLAGAFTKSSCVRLAGKERLAEIARLLSGLDSSQSALTHAAELLEMGARA